MTSDPTSSSYCYHLLYLDPLLFGCQCVLYLPVLPERIHISVYLSLEIVIYGLTMV